MEEKKDLLMKGAMTYGLSMGIYWVVKYLFFIFSIGTPSLGLVYWALTLAVPFIAYHMTRRYRTEIGGTISFGHAWQFGILLYFFAAVILSLEIFVFYRFIAPPDLLPDTIKQLTTLLQDSQVTPEMIDSLQKIDFSPIQMAIQSIFNNVFYGIIFSLPVAALVRGSARRYTGDTGH